MKECSDATGEGTFFSPFPFHLKKQKAGSPHLHFWCRNPAGFEISEQGSVSMLQINHFRPLHLALSQLTLSTRHSQVSHSRWRCLFQLSDLKSRSCYQTRLQLQR